MNDIGELKELWQSHPEKSLEISIENQDLVMDRFEKERRKILRGNLFSTIALSITTTFLVWMMYYYDDQQPLFYISIGAIIFIVLTVIFLLWMRSVKKVSQLNQDSKTYVDQQIRKLQFGGKLIRLSPLYGLIMGIMINVYAYSLIQNASPKFVFWMTNINWLYTIGISFISYKYKLKRYEKNVEPLVHELQTLSKALHK